jgi:peptidoglycan/LPS O-acetylase OafA/YrhL
MPVLVLLGNASYSIYLLQVIVLPAVGKAWLRFAPTLPPDLLVVVATVIAVLAGVAFYKFVEHPLQRALQPLLLRRPVVVPTPQAAET